MPEDFDIENVGLAAWHEDVMDSVRDYLSTQSKRKIGIISLPVKTRASLWDVDFSSDGRDHRLVWVLRKDRRVVGGGWFAKDGNQKVWTAGHASIVAQLHRKGIYSSLLRDLRIVLRAPIRGADTMSRSAREAWTKAGAGHFGGGKADNYESYYQINPRRRSRR